jgi:hypothetical protein
VILCSRRYLKRYQRQKKSETLKKRMQLRQHQE